MTYMVLCEYGTDPGGVVKRLEALVQHMIDDLGQENVEFVGGVSASDDADGYFTLAQAVSVKEEDDGKEKVEEDGPAA